MAGNRHNNNHSNSNSMAVFSQIKVSNHNRLASSHNRLASNLNPLGTETSLLCNPISQVILFKHNLQDILSRLNQGFPEASSSSTMLLNSRASRRELRQCRRFHNNSSSSLNKYSKPSHLQQLPCSNRKPRDLQRWQIHSNLLQNHRSQEDAEPLRVEQRYPV